MKQPFGIQFEKKLPLPDSFVYDAVKQTHGMTLRDMERMTETVSNPETGTGTRRDSDG